MYIKFCKDQFRMEELNMFPYMHGTRPLQKINTNFQVHHILDEAQVNCKDPELLENQAQDISMVSHVTCFEIWGPECHHLLKMITER